MEVFVKNKTWGGRFKKTLHPKAAAFNASLKTDYELYPYDILGSKVHAQMLAQQQLISLDEAEKICAGLDKIANKLDQGLPDRADDYEDIHMLIEQMLIAEIGETGKKLHTGRSRNDQVALDLRLYTRATIEQTLQNLQALIDVLTELATEHSQQLMPGYTHLQQAQPIYLGNYFLAYKDMFARDFGRFCDAMARMNFSPLGAGALAGSQLPLDRKMVAQALSFTGVIENTLDAVSDRDFIIEFCNAAAITMMHISRMAEDLIIWATAEFNFVHLDDAFATGSSLMPQKKNPDIPELLRGKAGRIFGHLLSMLTIMKGLPLAYNKDMQEDKEPLFDTAKQLHQCLSILPLFLQSVHFNGVHMEQQAKSGFLAATSIVEKLVQKGMPFREAHHQVGEWVAEAISKNCSLTEIIMEADDGFFDAC